MSFTILFENTSKNQKKISNETIDHGRVTETSLAEVLQILLP